MVAQLPRQDGGGLQTVLQAELVQHFGGVRQEMTAKECSSSRLVPVLFTVSLAVTYVLP